MYTTQWCESMNSYLKNFLHCKLPLREFVRHVDIALRNIREVENYEDYISTNTEPSYDHHAPLNSPLCHLGKILTRQVFHMVKLEVDMESHYNVVSMDTSERYNLYNLCKYSSGQCQYEVTHHLRDDHLNCSCDQFQTDGIPCHHLFAVIKHLNMEQLPPSLIKRRFTINARAGHSDLRLPNQVQMEPHLLRLSRYGSLSSVATNMNSLACQDEALYQEALELMTSLTTRFQSVLQHRQNNAQYHNSTEHNAAHRSPRRRRLLMDPQVVRTKGCGAVEVNQDGRQHRKAHRCSKCGLQGHNRSSCKADFDLRARTPTTTQDIPPHTTEHTISNNAFSYSKKNSPSPIVPFTVTILPGSSNTQTMNRDANTGNSFIPPPPPFMHQDRAEEGSTGQPWRFQ